MSFADIQGLTVYYKLDRSHGDPVLVFINSLGTDLRIWDDMIMELSSRYSILRYDKRGHGLTDSPPGPYSLQDFSDDLAGLLDYLQIPQILLVGISIGGMIALDFAARYADRLAALVVSDTGLKIGTAEMWTQRAQTLREHGMPYLTATILERWFASDYAQRQPVDHQGYYNMLSRMPLDGYTASCEALATGDVSAEAASIKVPALVIVGDDDSATPPHLAQQIVETIPQAAYIEIAGAGHLPCIEQPVSMAGAIVTFLKEQGYGR